MMTQFPKKLLAGSLVGFATYKVLQSIKPFRHPLQSFNPKERLLAPNDDHLAIQWLHEDCFEEEWNQQLMPYLLDRMESGKIQSQDFALAYDFYQADRAQATLVLVHGFNEFKEKYREVIYYFLQAGIQVLVYDARGHGHSKKSDHHTMVDCHSFEDYLTDLDLMVDYARQRSGSDTPLWLMGHSMGGAVVTGYGQVQEQKIDGLILSAPMMAIETGGIPAEWLHLFTDRAKKLGYGHRYIPTTTDKEALKRLTYQTNNKLCNSDSRGSFYHALNFSEHQYPTFSASINWLDSALDFLQVINQPERIEGMNLPVLQFRAEKDQIVRANGNYNLGYYLPNALNIVVPNSQHEILAGHDPQVQAVISQILPFIQSHS